MSKPWRRVYYVFLAAFLVGMRRALHEGDPLAALRPLLDGSTEQVSALAAEWLMWLVLIWLSVEVLAPLLRGGGRHDAQ